MQSSPKRLNRSNGSLTQKYQKVATTSVTVANGDILPAKEAEHISFKTDHGYISFTDVLHVQDWMQKESETLFGADRGSPNAREIGCSQIWIWFAEQA